MSGKKRKSRKTAGAINRPAYAVAPPQKFQPMKCSPGGDCGCSVANLSRREFLKVTGVGAVLATLGESVRVMAGPFEKQSGEVTHFVPADKKLSPEWLRALYERGEPEVFSGAALDNIGMPCGGVAAGQLYLRGDGTLSCWQIFNRTVPPQQPPGQGFALIAESGGRRISKTLSKTGFADVGFTGRYPIAEIRYGEPGFPFKARMEVFSPFIPLNAKDSALPATVFNITVENISGGPARAGIAGWLENAVCQYTDLDQDGIRRTAYARGNGRAFILHSAEPAPPPPSGNEPPREPIIFDDFEKDTYAKWIVEGEAFGKGPAKGTLPNQQPVSGFLGKGLVNSYLGGDQPTGRMTSPPFKIRRRFINFLIGGGGYQSLTCINLMVDGRVVRSAIGKNDERLEWRSWNVEQLTGKKAQIVIVDSNRGGWGHVNVDQIEFSDERKADPQKDFKDLDDNGTMALAFGCDATPPASGGDIPDALSEIAPAAGAALRFPDRPAGAMLTQPVELAPGASHTFTAVLAWHFPNHPRGHEYANRFESARAVADYVLDNSGRLAGDTRLWRDTFYTDGSLPHWLLSRLHSTVSNLATGTCQWWKNGRFWAWEGVGCCEGTCTHVWNYAHAEARLFPELALSVRKMQDFEEKQGGYDPATGLVGFRSDRNYAADGQSGTILKAYRESLMSPDLSFLKEYWPRISKALEFMIRQDGDSNGVIENSQPNTYDIAFEGPNTFVGSLYLAALRAGMEMALDMNDPGLADRYRKIFERGGGFSAEKLFDGEYFIQDVDLEKYPKFQYGKGCLSDQLFGQGWAHQVGLGYVYPREEVRKALESIWKYNWAPDITLQNRAHVPGRWFISPGEAGLIVCTWPKSRHLDQGVLYQNEVWTGIEYQVAGHMVWEGMVEESLAICRAVHDRYNPARRNPYNEIECGDHYARALASWGVYLALCGYEYNGPAGRLAFAPRLSPEKFAAAFTAAEGWGLFSQSREGGAQRERIEVRKGKLRLKTLAVRIADTAVKPSARATLGDKNIPVGIAKEDDRIILSFDHEIIVGENEPLEVTITS